MMAATIIRMVATTTVTMATRTLVSARVSENSFGRVLKSLFISERDFILDSYDTSQR